MRLNEFAIIDKYFKSKNHDKNVKVGVGDDAAILAIPQNKNLVTSIDALVADVHFFKNQDPESIGYKALAVNLSDLAAMGAEPAWASLALTLPQTDETWLKKFSRGFFNLLNTYNMQLIGGNIAKGPLNIAVQVFGFIPTQSQSLLRHAAKPNDKIYVTNNLGDAAFALHSKKRKINLSAKNNAYFEKKLLYPTPRVCIGILLREIANAAIDISDGLLQDINHILQASKVGATLSAADIPLSKNLLRYNSFDAALKHALTGGDDYELCFTVSEKNEKKLFQLAKKHQLKFYCIGTITKEKQLRIIDQNGQTKNFDKLGYKHFG